MKIVIITGEESGDELGASLVDALKESYLNAEDEFDLEHVTPYILRNKQFKKHSLKNNKNLYKIFGSKPQAMMKYLKEGNNKHSLLVEHNHILDFTFNCVF